MLRYRIRRRHWVYLAAGVIVVGFLIPLWSETARAGGELGHAATFFGSILVTIGWIVSAEVTIGNSRRQHTITLITQHAFDPTRALNRDVIKSYLPRYNTTLTVSFAHNGVVVDFDDERHELLKAIDLELNFYEFLSVGISRGDLDERLIEQSLRTQFMNFFRQTEPYIAHWRDKNRSTWRELSDLYGRWSAVAAPDRWLQLALGFIVMMTISSPQYTWTLFTGPLQQTTGALLSDVQWTITILIVLQTWLAPLQGWLVDRFGPKLLIGAGTVISGLGWMAAAGVTSLWGLYLTYGLLCGLGTGVVYIGVIGLMVRWFPDRRGLATGVAAAGYGFGAILTTFPIDAMIKTAGYETTLLTFGVLFACVGLLGALFLRAPTVGDGSISRRWLVPRQCAAVPRRRCCARGCSG